MITIRVQVRSGLGSGIYLELLVGPACHSALSRGTMGAIRSSRYWAFVGYAKGGEQQQGAVRNSKGLFATVSGSLLQLEVSLG